MPVKKFDRILVAIADPAYGMNEAIRRARALARTSGASIELFNAIPAAMSVGTAHAAAEQFTRYEEAENRRQLERTANRLRREELIVTVTVQTGYPVHQAILRQVRISKADLLVIEAHKHSVFARLLLTQTDFELIRHCPVPMLIVKGRAAWRSPRIVAALDPFHSNDKPSALDGEIVAAAGTVAGLIRGSLHAAHIYRPLASYVADSPLAPYAQAAVPAQEKEYGRSVKKRFYEALGRYDIPKNRGHLIAGDPAIELPRLARSLRAGLIVMGAISRSGLKRIFIGSTAEHALNALPCDVLVVKTRN